MSVEKASIQLPTSSNNWFTPTNYSKSQHGKYDFDAFRTEIFKQLHSVLHIDHATRITGDRNYFLEDISMLIERHQYEALAARVSAERARETTTSSKSCDSGVAAMFPLMTFHATSNSTKLNSIRKYGYIVPGQQHPTYGWRLTMRTGNLYGDGVYSSPQFETAQWFGFVDASQRVQLLVNMLLPGRVKTVAAEKWFPDR